MSKCGPWTIDDFEAMSWHDVHVHGFRLDSLDSDLGVADLVLDIDFILEWKELDGKFEFEIAQADLRFHKVFNLKLTLDYLTPTAGMCPFSIAHIERETIKYPDGTGCFRWHIPINWPNGALEFEALGFTQTLTGEIYVQSGQWLEAGQRNSANAT